MVKVSKGEFLKVLEIFDEELGSPSYCQEVKRYYVSRGEGRGFSLTEEGNPAPQLKDDLERTELEAFGHLYRDVRRCEVLVLFKQDQLKGAKFSSDSFPSATRRVLSSLNLSVSGGVVVSLENGLKGETSSELATFLNGWRRAYKAEFEKYRGKAKKTGVKGYKELSLFTFVGFLGGLGLGAFLDRLGFATSAVGEWAVRTLSGEGEDISEGIWVVKSRWGKKRKVEEKEELEESDEEGEGLIWFESEAAEAYGLGKVVGMSVPWIVDALSRALGVDVRAPEGTYVAYLYSLADQIGANISGLRHHIQKGGGIRQGLSNYFRDLVMVASLLVITLAPLALFTVRSLGFRPTVLFLAAMEGVLLNLCWVPPAVAWFWDYSMQRGLQGVINEYSERARGLSMSIDKSSCSK